MGSTTGETTVIVRDCGLALDGEKMKADGLSGGCGDGEKNVSDVFAVVAEE